MQQSTNVSASARTSPFGEWTGPQGLPSSSDPDLPAQQFVSGFVQRPARLLTPAVQRVLEWHQRHAGRH